MRYAIYFAAIAEDRLMQLGNHWLGRDPFTGSGLEQPAVVGMTGARVSELTTSPRRYGFHGTLKAPFRLREGTSEKELLGACASFAAKLPAFSIQGLKVNRLGKFLALTPAQDEPDLRAFAGNCVKEFEPFRAPLSEVDLERRRKNGLSPKQDEYLVDWGYPYIFDEFRFHMTLSERIVDPTESERLMDAANIHFLELLNQPRTCRHFALYFEPEAGAPFQVQRVFELTGQNAQ